MLSMHTSQQVLISHTQGSSMLSAAEATPTNTASSLALKHHVSPSVCITTPYIGTQLLQLLQGGATWLQLHRCCSIAVRLYLQPGAGHQLHLCIPHDAPDAR